MNAAFDKLFTQSMRLVVSYYEGAIRKVAFQPERAQSTHQVLLHLMDTMVEKGLINAYLCGDELHISRDDFRKSPRSPYPSNPNYLSIPRLTDTLNIFLMEQGRLTDTNPDDPWFRQVERQLTHDIVRSFKFTGLIKDYTLAGNNLGVVGQDPAYFLTAQQQAKLKAHTRDDSPSP